MAFLFASRWGYNSEQKPLAFLVILLSALVEELHEQLQGHYDAFVCLLLVLWLQEFILKTANLAVN